MKLLSQKQQCAWCGSNVGVSTSGIIPGAAVAMSCCRCRMRSTDPCGALIRWPFPCGQCRRPTAGITKASHGSAERPTAYDESSRKIRLTRVYTSSRTTCAHEHFRFSTVFSIVRGLSSVVLTKNFPFGRKCIVPGVYTGMHFH